MAKAGKSALKPIPGLRVLLSNDDGINAPGLKVLEKIAKTISDDVWIIAPETEHSGASHSLSLHNPLRIRQISKRKFAVQGTPTDCVMVGVNHVFKDQQKPGLLLSGVNRGANLGEDVTYSGTVAAAMEGTLVGIPSISMSQVGQRLERIKWAPAEKHGPALVRKLFDEGWPKDVLVNINFPDVPASAKVGINVCRQGKRDLGSMFIDERIDARGRNYYWIGFRDVVGAPEPSTDLAAVEQGDIAVTPLQLDLTHQATRRKLAKALA